MIAVTRDGFCCDLYPVHIHVTSRVAWREERDVIAGTDGLHDGRAARTVHVAAFVQY